MKAALKELFIFSTLALCFASLDAAPYRAAAHAIRVSVFLPPGSSGQIEKIYEPEEVDERATITERSMPQYTEEARRKHTSGWVVLRVVLKASGEIGDIKVIRDLPDGLTQECIKAARATKFKPARKEGQPVSMYARFEYTFDAY
jgi:TonB family protein